LHDSALQVEGAGGLDSKEWAVAAEGNQREVSRIPTALDRNRAHRPRDAGATDEIGAEGSFLQWQIPYFIWRGEKLTSGVVAHGSG